MIRSNALRNRCTGLTSCGEILYAMVNYPAAAYEATSREILTRLLERDDIPGGPLFCEGKNDYRELESEPRKRL